MKQNLFLIYVLLFLVPGCMVGPKYKQPHVALPSQFIEQKEQPCAKNLNLKIWWQQFHDPHLNLLIQHALETNYDLRIALEKITESRALLRGAHAELFPRADVTTNIINNRLSNAVTQNTAVTKCKLTDYRFALDGLWELDVFGKLRHAKQAALYDYQAQIEDTRDVYILVIADVAQAYISARAAQKKIKLLEHILKIENKLLQLNTDLFQSGLQSCIELKQQEQAVAQITTELFVEQTTRAQNIYRIAVLLGKNPEEFHLSNCATIPMPHHYVRAGLPSELLRRRPDIRKAEETIKAENERVGQAVAQWFPSFTLLGGVGTRTNKGSTLFASNALIWNIGPSVSIPVLNFGRIKALVLAQESQYRQAVLNYSNIIISAFEEVENALNAYFSEQDTLKSLTKKTYSAQQEFILQKSLFKSGLANQLNALRTYKNFIRTLLQRTNSQEQLSLQMVRVYKALGGGW